MNRMFAKLSPETRRRVDMMCPLEQREAVTRYLVEECGHNIPGWHASDEDEYSFERVRFAALKASNGDIQVLKNAIELAKQDYREPLGAAGFSWDTTDAKRKRRVARSGTGDEKWRSRTSGRGSLDR